MEEIYLSKDIKKILGKIDYSRLGEAVAIKLHFGEKGCSTYVNPEIVKAVYDKIISLGKKASLIECNVLYRGSRTNTTDHLATAKEHGFDFALINILDGENGQEYLKVDIDGLIKKAKLGRGLQDYDSMIVISHLTGHMMAGFGGALKNVGMGLGSRAGKLQMHSEISPSVNIERCTACKTCIEYCNADAIEIINGKAKINNKKCEGCAMCIAVCPQKAVKIPWDSSTASDLQKRMVDYVDAVFKIISKDKMIFINVLENITKECDCFGIIQEPIMEDIGILTGNDIVAIDKASTDLIKEKGKDLDGQVQIDYAAERGLGSRDYEIVGLDG